MAEQEADEQLLHLRRWLDDRVAPPEDTIMLWAPAENFLWINREVSHRADSLICKRHGDRDLVVAPKSLVPEIMHVGQAGRERMKALLKQHYFWYGLRLDVKEYVRACPKCNQNKKASRYGHSPMKNYHAGAPMERVHLDF